MKKKIIVFIVTLLLIFPVGISATTISSVSMEGASEKTVGDKLYISFRVNFNDLKMATLDTEGLYIVGVEFSFDESVLALMGVSSNHFDSTVYYDSASKRYALMSIVKSENDISNRCNDQFLYCANYLATLTFYVNNTTSETTSINTHEYIAGVFKVNNEGEYDINNMKELNLVKSETKTIKINQPSTAVNNKETSIVENSKPTITPPKSNSSSSVNSSTPTETKTDKSSNTNLKKLEIKNYKIDFQKDKYTYEITIPEEINTLSLSVETEDSKATYQIVGDKDLKANKNRIKITVTAEDGSKQNYRINVKKDASRTKDKEEKKVMSKLNLVAYSIVGIIIIITIICIIASIISKRKLNKLLNEEISNRKK